MYKAKTRQDCIRSNHGKLGVPDGILLQPGPLTAEERKLMQRHSQIGFDLVKDIPFLADATDVVLMHHERFDGSGYPQGLKAQQIPLSALRQYCALSPPHAFDFIVFRSMFEPEGIQPKSEGS